MSPPATPSRARRPPHEPLAEWERDLLEGEKKEDAEKAAEAAKPETDVQTSAETEKVADAEAEAPVADAEAPVADAEQA